MIPGATTPYFQHNHQSFQMFDAIDELLPPSTGGHVDGQAQNLMYNLSVLKDKIQQLQTLVGLAVAPSSARLEPVAVTVPGAEVVIQEIIGAASSMMYAFQQAELGSLGTSRGAIGEEEMSHHNNIRVKSSYDGSSQATSEVIDHVLHNLDASGARKGLYTNIHEANYNCNNGIMSPTMKAPHQRVDGSSSNKSRNSTDQDEQAAAGSFSCDIIELDAADLLAKYTHYCQVCGKGFKRDANLRMHMRAHGDEYKSNSALTKPPKGAGDCGKGAAADCAAAAQRYSCPQEGCRWNWKHAKFRPLKSIICAKNHYKRSHCPKMYVCNRCNGKQFSVLSDLRTHEKHCGDTKWLCSCGTTFSRKDKLMGHVALFVGHAPVVGCFGKQLEKGEEKDFMEST